MMITAIREAIASINAHNATTISDWRLVERRLEREERYYVAGRAEQARAVDETLYSLTVYVDTIENGTPGQTAGKWRGEATITIQPSFSRTECEAKIRQAAFAASKSHNPWFELPGPSSPKISVPVSGFEALSPAERIETVRHALFSVESGFAGSARINALELFITRETRRLLNSRGFDHVSTMWRGYSEFVVEADSTSGTVELFDDIEFSEPDTDRLSEAVKTRLAQVRDRARAVPMPALKGLPVILRGKEAEEVFGWFFQNSRTEMIYSKASAFEAGRSVQESPAGEVPVEPIDVVAEPVLKGLPASSAVTGGSISGSLSTLRAAMRRSREVGLAARSLCPKAVMFQGTIISGAC